MHYQSDQPKTMQAPRLGLRLDNIAEDVQHMIAVELDLLSPSSLRAMSQSSRTLRRAASPLVYRDLVLLKENDAAETVRKYEAIVERFRDRGECSIARHVRNLVVKDELPVDHLMLILDAISDLGLLRKLGWETTAHMPPSVLDKLHENWPDLEISVCVLGRQHATKDEQRQVDEKLLSSSLLRSLTYNIVYEGYSRHSRSDVSSDWVRICRAISTGGSLRALRVEPQNGGQGIGELDMASLLDISGNSQLPVLEELTLGPVFWNWVKEDSEIFARSVDFSRLRTLNFVRGMLFTFTNAFVGQLPSLKTLRIGAIDDGHTTAVFIKSIKGLESLNISGPVATVDVVWPAIMQHRNTLKDLCIRGLVEFRHLEEVVESFPSLQYLGWNVPFEDRSKWLKLLSRINLERLELFMHLSWTASEYCDKLTPVGRGRTETESPSLNIEQIRASAVESMQDKIDGEGNRLERFTMHFTRILSDDRGDPLDIYAILQVRRNKRAGTKDQFEVRGKHTWSYSDVVDEELELEWPVAAPKFRPRTAPFALRI